VTWGLRPEHLALAPAGLPAEVVVIEPTGSETHLVLRAGEQELLAISRDRVSLRPGDQVHLAPDAAQVHLFDGTTGKRL
jgi:multiple sugar transport system ATP-binding protein